VEWIISYRLGSSARRILIFRECHGHFEAAVSGGVAHFAESLLYGRSKDLYQKAKKKSDVIEAPSNPRDICHRGTEIVRNHPQQSKAIEVRGSTLP
jgi:hypothetical protein